MACLRGNRTVVTHSSCLRVSGTKTFQINCDNLFMLFSVVPAHVSIVFHSDDGFNCAAPAACDITSQLRTGAHGLADGGLRLILQSAGFILGSDWIKQD